MPIRDAKLLNIMDTAFADAAKRAGDWLACKPGCTACCHGTFAIHALDAARLRAGMKTLEPTLAATVKARAKQWIAEHAAEFPGDLATGILGTSEQDQAAFEDFANDAPCPALNPTTGLCDVYAYRPMTCRSFGPPVRVPTDDADESAFACCELCFVEAPEETIAACELHVPHALEEELLDSFHDQRETILAFALL